MRASCVRRASRREHDGRDYLGRRFVIQRRRHVTVDAERDRDGGVTEPFLYDPGVDALLESQGRPCVPEAVKGQTWQALPCNASQEGRTDCVRAQPPPVGLVEHQALVDEVWPHEKSLLIRAMPQRAKDIDGGMVQLHRPSATVGLGLADRHLAAGLDHRLHDTQPTRIKIKVGPPKTERLSPPKSRSGQQYPQRIEPVLLGAARLEETTKRAAIPSVNAARLVRDPRRIGGVGRVTGKATPANRVPEGAVHDRVDVGHGPGVEAGTEHVRGELEQPAWLRGPDQPQRQASATAVPLLSPSVLRQNAGR